jgi:hypothetical protein
MKHPKQALKNNILAAAITTALGTTVIMAPSSAANLTFSVEGWFTMLNPLGDGALNNGDASGAGYYGNRTPIQGTLTYNTDTGSGTGVIAPFSFFGSGVAAATALTMQTIGDGTGGTGSLVLGNMGFNWAGNNGIPVSIVWDGTGLFNAIDTGITVGDSLGSPDAAASTLTCGNQIACTTAATENFGFLIGKATYTLPMGPSPMVTTTFNTTDIGIVTLGTNPSGTLPLTDDGIGGSPMKAGPFPLFNASFDVTHMVLTDDGSGPAFTPPPDVNQTATGITSTPVIGYTVPIGTVTDEPAGTTASYSSDGKPISDATKTWVADNGTNNILNIDLNQTVTELTVDWRVQGGGTSYQTQNVKVTIEDLTKPVISSTPLAVNVNVASTAEQVCFGAATATDVIDPDPEVQYAINGEFNWQTADPTDNCSTGFGPNSNTVFWRAVDASDNVSDVTQQTVTLNLPAGVVGKACTVDLGTEGFRDVDGQFIMFNPSGAQAGDTDNTVTGQMDTSLLCDDPETCTQVGASLITSQAFYGSLWTASPIRLFPEGTWTFETCPGDESSGVCYDATPGDTTLTMTVGPGQLGAHMLFDWSVNKDIDVVVVWDVACNQFMLTTTDPDGDGTLGTPMVDGPFKGFSATFNLNTVTGEIPIADGGFQISVPAYQNPDSGKSPIVIADFTERDDLPPDNAMKASCVGGCFEFETDGLLPGSDANGDYQYASVAIPLSAETPFYSLYRKFDPNTGTWGGFVFDDRNNVMTAPRDPNTGLCPEPGKGSYSRSESGTLEYKLNGGDGCLQLTIEDNGPDDSNNAIGIVGDPGGVAEADTPSLKKASTSGGGCTLSDTPVTSRKRIDWWLSGGFIIWLGLKLRRMRSLRS